MALILRCFDKPNHSNNIPAIVWNLWEEEVLQDAGGPELLTKAPWRFLKMVVRFKDLRSQCDYKVSFLTSVICGVSSRGEAYRKVKQGRIGSEGAVLKGRQKRCSGYENKNGDTNGKEIIDKKVPMTMRFRRLLKFLSKRWQEIRNKTASWETATTRAIVRCRILIRYVRTGKNFATSYCSGAHEAKRLISTVILSTVLILIICKLQPLSWLFLETTFGAIIYWHVIIGRPTKMPAWKPFIIESIDYGFDKTITVQSLR